MLQLINNFVRYILPKQYTKNKLEKVYKII